MEETEIRNFLVASGVEDDSIDYVMGMLQEEMPKSLEEVADLVGSFLDDDEVRISKLWTIIGAHRNNSACGPGGAATSPSQTSPADKDSALPTADAALLNSMSATEMRVLAGKSLGELLNDKNCSGDGTTEKETKALTWWKYPMTTGEGCARRCGQNLFLQVYPTLKPNTSGPRGCHAIFEVVVSATNN